MLVKNYEKIPLWKLNAVIVRMLKGFQKDTGAVALKNKICRKQWKQMK